MRDIEIESVEGGRQVVPSDGNESEQIDKLLRQGWAAARVVTDRGDGLWIGLDKRGRLIGLLYKR